MMKNLKLYINEKTQLLEDNLTNIHNSIIENVTSSSDETKIQWLMIEQ